MKKIGSQILVAIVCALLGFLLTYQFKLLTDKNKENVIENNSDILLEIENLKKEKKELEETNMSLSEELKKLEEAAAKEGEVEGEIKKLLYNARMQIGLLDVKGPGIILTITPKNSIFSTNSTQNVKSISEEELVNIVNSLWYSNAEAISINDMRITPQTGIKTAGSYISISSAGRIDPNAEIVIKAIGDKSKLNVGVNYAGALDYGALKYYDKDIKTLDDIIINKTTQSLKSEYMTPVQ